MRDLRGKAEERLLRITHTFVGMPLLCLLACATGVSDNPFTQEDDFDPYLLRVESRNTFEVSIFVNPSGRRQLLGTVAGNGLQIFEFQYPRNRPLYVELEDRMGERYRMPAAPFPVGGRIYLVIDDDIRRSVYIRGSLSRLLDWQGSSPAVSRGSLSDWGVLTIL